MVKENQYRQVPRVEQMTVYFEIDGNMVDKSSEEEPKFPSDDENGEELVNRKFHMITVIREKSQLINLKGN